MDTIKDLYYGNVHPFERDIKKDRLFGKFKGVVTELNCLNECEGFINGFCLGIRLMVEALRTEE